MKRVVISLIVAMVAVIISIITVQASQKQVLITEVQTGGTSSAGEEFVEIYNITSQDIDISGWSLYYKSATGKTWTKKAVVGENVVLQGDDFWVFSANLPGDIQFSSGFAQSGGNVQLRDAQGNTVDQFGWGSGDAALGVPASESQAGQSMYRLYDFTSSVMTNTDNNFSDYDLTDRPTPVPFLSWLLSKRPTGLRFTLVYN